MMALTTIGRRLGTPISRCGGDLTIAEMLSDSIVQALMVHRQPLSRHSFRRL